jgi:hypothetical protein
VAAAKVAGSPEPIISTVLPYGTTAQSSGTPRAITARTTRRMPLAGGADLASVAAMLPARSRIPQKIR